MTALVMSQHLFYLLLLLWHTETENLNEVFNTAAKILHNGQKLFEAVYFVKTQGVTTLVSHIKDIATNLKLRMNLE